MARFSSAYKQTGPTRRIVQGEDTYEKGMYWTNSVSGQGYVHTLLNYEIDQLSYDVHVAGGLHVTDAAAGCTYLDRATFGAGEANIIVLQGRNEYNLRAFEGITNIISANKLTIKNNQTLEEKLRQQGFTADDVVCYKLLTYNPINHRLMSVTLIQAKRDKYFVVDNTYNLRRINSNPISCGFSEVWETLDGGMYVSNKLDYHPQGKSDYFVPRARRNSYDETFGQSLHSPLYMQTVPNCEGYGNKTFCFTKKKQVDITGEIKDTTEIIYKDVARIINLRWGLNGKVGYGFQLGDIITIEAANPDNTVTPQRVKVQTLVESYAIKANTTASVPNGTASMPWRTTDDWDTIIFGNLVISKSEYMSGKAYTLYNGTSGLVTVSYRSSSAPIYFNSTIDGTVQVDIIYAVLGYGVGEVVEETRGVFEGVASSYPNASSFVTKVIRNGQDVTDQIEDMVGWTFSLENQRIINNEHTPEVTTEDIYFKHMNTGLKQVYNALLNNAAVPVDVFRYGIVMTGCAITPSTVTISSAAVQPADANKVWCTDLVEKIAPTGVAPVFKLNLADGTLTPTESVLASNVSLQIQALPYLDRGVSGQPNTLFRPADAFEGVTINNWGSSPEAVHPSIWLKENIRKTLRIGQGFRIAAHCIAAKNPARSINTLREDPLSSKYYDTEVTAVFVLDYVWNGTSWDFSFVDTSVEMYENDQELTLVENWELDGKDELGNTIARHYAWLNCLAYTDVISENNMDKLSKHIVDDLAAPKMIYNKNSKVALRGSSVNLVQDIDDTIESNFPASANIKNNSKLADISYGHFEVIPKALTPSEAALWGYNMLSNTPYTFECINTPGTQTASLTGVLLKSIKDTNKVLLKPVINTPGVLEVYYQSDRSYFNESTLAQLQLTIEYKNPADDWRDLKIYSKVQTSEILASGTPLQVDFTGADETTLIRVTLRDLATKIETPNETFTATEETFLVVDQIITTLSYTKDTTKVEPSPEIYDLGSATGITYWKGRLVLWGVLNAENMLFLSEPNEPEYFAYPNGADIFEENIVHVITYSDALIVFTSTKLWRVDLNADGLSWNKTLLQQNLRIVDQDIPYITILKNMLFFKSDKQFYMLVPSRSSTVGELTIAPISKAIKEFLENPFAAIRDIVHTIYPDLAGRDYSSPMVGTLGVDGKLIDIPERPITDYLVKYGVHTEQSRVMVDWWFDITDWKNQTANYGNQVAQHEVTLSATPEESATYLHKEYWLVQLIYDTETYGWTMRTHTTNNIGVFIADAVNQDTDFISLTFSPEPLDEEGKKLFDINAMSTWGVSISHRRQPADRVLKQFSLGSNPAELLEPAYPRFQVFDTGYKDVSSPALKKRFREIQIAFEPSPNTEEGLRATYTAMIDGHTVMSAVSQEVYEETEADPITGSRTIVKIVDRLNFHDANLLDPNAPANYVPLPYLVDGQLSNTFVLDSSALAGVKQVKIRRQINGKGYLVRARFVNITHADYSIANYAFVSHNKNAR